MGTLLALPHGCVPLIPGDTLVGVVPTSPEARNHQCEDHEVTVRGSSCCVNVVPSYLPACRDAVMLRGVPGSPPAEDREGTPLCHYLQCPCTRS